MALILGGGSRSEAAKVAGVTLQIVRDWILRFNEGGPDCLATSKAPGRASILDDEQRARLAKIVETDPIPTAHGMAQRPPADRSSGYGMSSRSPGLSGFPCGSAHNG